MFKNNNPSEDLWYYNHFQIIFVHYGSGAVDFVESNYIYLYNTLYTIQYYSPGIILRSSNKFILTIPCARLKLKGDHAFSVAGPRL